MTDFATSADGTRIAYDRFGEGPAVVLVAGAMQQRSGDAATARMAELLAERGFTVVNYDRRGRGESGPVRTEDAGSEVQREIDDIAALVDACGGEAALFGNSSGGALCLWAAHAGVGATRLALWEVPLAITDNGEAAEFAAEMRKRIAAGENESAVEYFMKDMPAEWLEGAKNSGAWPAMVALAPSLVADSAALATHEVPREQLWANVTQPTLVMVGDQTLPNFPPAGELLVETLANAQQQTLPASYHQWQPEVMADALAAFLRT